ncbi:hypothetical protein K402DRAFT_454305 [Aulographum hederae CBS 113979]|uniref:Uncharacterized protein n=1 Tax=Aulographum hederae CBS 113979 TaxID=1176131 RepID=A0A6G1GZ93_9PEZI|nr:hypothetical protein K402DRAFT_454305 [Aulographum hederae CBS 113979]
MAAAKEHSQQSSDSSRESTLSPLSDTATSPSSTFGECLLFSLPRELRDRIYTYALVSPSPIPWPSENLAADLSPQFLCANRQIHEEGAKVLYGSNTFLFTHPSDANMFPWAHNLERCADITRLNFYIRDRDFSSLWSDYLGSNNGTRSLKWDYRKLHRIDVTYRSLYWGQFPHMFGPQPIPNNAMERFVRFQHEPKFQQLISALLRERDVNIDIHVVSRHTVPKPDYDELILAHPSLWASFGERGEARTGFEPVQIKDAKTGQVTICERKIRVALEICPIDSVVG